MKVKIIVATHKPYRIPEDACYLPIHVGKQGKRGFGYTGDDTGDNISSKNPYYCELTGLYWAWKNIDADYLGLVHYRRYLGSRKLRKRILVRDKYKKLLTEKEICSLLKKTDIIVPEKRRYYIESLYSHYAHTHYAEHLDLVRRIIKQKTPEYLEAFDKAMKSSSGHMFNMFIMSREKCDAYCSWIFQILFELEKEIDTEKYDAFQRRLFGRVSEILFNVWLLKNNYKYITAPVINMEGGNQFRKIKAFLNAKFLGKKYASSF